MDKSINKTALLFDLISVGNFGHKKITINKDYKDYFKGEFNRSFVGNGDYRLSIANGNSCGEVLFIVRDGQMKNKKFNCINRCSL